MGSIIAVWQSECVVGGGTLSNCILIKGSVEQVGKKPRCPVDFPDWTLLGGGPFSPQEFFQNFKPSDLKGSCLIHLQAAFNACSPVPGFPELLAVGDLKYGGEECAKEGYTSTIPTDPYYVNNCLTAHAVIMQVFVP
jgi:hypothetical protein